MSTTAPPRRPRLSPVAVDALLVTAALLDTLSASLHATHPVQTVLGTIAATGLVFRRRWPWFSLLLVVPALIASSVFVAGLIALYSVAVAERRRWTVLLAGAVYAVASSTLLCQVVLVEGAMPPDLDLVGSLTSTVLSVAAPIALGLLVRTRRDLTARLHDLEQAAESERRHAARVVLATERARIAREMHDVVSHQVSLLAVQAGALQVDASEPSVRSAARTMRSLAVQTLDELRQMVSVLRITGATSGPLAPQPTLTDLSALIQSSGIRTMSVLDLPSELPASVPRTIYRTVQEALTNIRKHAPGAEATITARVVDGVITVTVHNSPATSPPMDLPSAGHGLVGLRERADLLGGTLTTRSDADGGHTLTLRIPHP